MTDVSSTVSGALAQFASHTEVGPKLQAWLYILNLGDAPDEVVKATGMEAIRAIEALFPLGGYDTRHLREALNAPEVAG